MIPSAFENVKRLPDDQLARVIQSAKQGDMTAIEALNLTSATPVLAEMMRRNRIRETLQKNMMAGAPDPKTVLDKQLAQAQATQGIGDLEIPGMMEEQAYAGGGIVAFSGGGSAAGFVEPPPGAALEEGEVGGDRFVGIDRLLAMTPRERHILEVERARREGEEEIAAETPVKAFTPEEQQRMFDERLKLLQGVTKPYQDRLQKLMDQGRIDEPKRKEDLERSAYNQAFLSMIGRRKLPGVSGIGSAVSNIAEAARGGVDFYEKGIAQLEEAKRLRARAEMDAIKAEQAMAKGDYIEARKYADDSTDAQNKAAQNYQRGIRGIRRATSDRVTALGRDYVGEMQAEARARETARKEKEDRDEARARDRRIELLAGRGSGGGDSRTVTAINNIAREMKADAQTVRQVKEQVKKENPGASPAELAAAFTDKIDNLAAAAYHHRRVLGKDGAPKPGEKPSEKSKAATQLPEGAVVIPL